MICRVFIQIWLYVSVLRKELEPVAGLFEDKTSYSILEYLSGVCTFPQVRGSRSLGHQRVPAPLYKNGEGLAGWLVVFSVLITIINEPSELMGCLDHR